MTGPTSTARWPPLRTTVRDLPARAAGDFERAEAAHTSASSWYVGADLPAGIAFSEACLGFLAVDRDDLRAAATHHELALSAATSSGDDPTLALALEGIAAIDDRPETAAALLGAADRRWVDADEHRPAALAGAVDQVASACTPVAR